MKKLKISFISLTLVFVLVLNGYSQGYYEWGEPFPLTDSLSDNANPYMHLNYDNGMRLYMVWEKQTDSLSSSIFMDNILDAEPPQEILSASGVQYKNPKIMYANYYPDCDSNFFILYESNENGNIDIYFKTYMKDGSFLPAEPLVTSPFDDYQLSVGGQDYWDAGGSFRNTAIYIRNDSLFAKNLMRDGWYIFFSDEILIDSTDCSDPTTIGNYVSYLKKESEEYHIYQSACNVSGNWSSPQVVYDSADCRNPNFSLHYSTLVWSAYKDSIWKILTKDPWGYEINTYEITKETPFNPAALGLVIGVKSWWPELWIATPYPENDTNEIYMSIEAGWSEFGNFSQGGSDNRNPCFFVGEPTNYCQYDYLLWESYRNGHWQIWASKVLQCAGSVDEIDKETSFISTYPNPFTNEITLEFTLETQTDVLIEVYNNRGVKVDEFIKQGLDQGQHQLRWNSQELPDGIYIIKMTIGDKSYSSKVIKSH